MTENQRVKVQEHAVALKRTQGTVQEEEGYSLEFEWREDEKCAYLTGNNAGLLHLARLLLDLCAKESETAHLHLDKYSNFGEECDTLLTARSFEDNT